MDGPSLQERYAPEGRCFGCGQANASGLRIRSHEAPDGSVVATWVPRSEREVFAGFVNGGILGTLLDCHANWTTIAALISQDGLTVAPSSVTAELSVRFRRPTPLGAPVHLVGRVVELLADRAIVEATASSGGVATASGRATFVVVGPDHPAFGRW